MFCWNEPVYSGWRVARIEDRVLPFKADSVRTSTDSAGRFIHWLQDVPDQAAIIRQYCRYTAEIKTGHNIKQMVYRSLQFATSDPKGPVYLMAAREALEQVIILS